MKLMAEAQEDDHTNDRLISDETYAYRGFIAFNVLCIFSGLSCYLAVLSENWTNMIYGVGSFGISMFFLYLDSVS